MLDRKLAIEAQGAQPPSLFAGRLPLKALSRHSLICQNRKPATSSTPPVFSDKAQEFLRKRAGEATPKNYPCTRAHLYTPTGVCALPRLYLPHQALLPCAEIGGLRRDRETYTFLRQLALHLPFCVLTKANTLLCKLFTFMGFC